LLIADLRPAEAENANIHIGFAKPALFHFLPDPIRAPVPTAGASSKRTGLVECETSRNRTPQPSREVSVDEKHFLSKPFLSLTQRIG
jgi:hypothetical protein